MRSLGRGGAGRASLLIILGILLSMLLGWFGSIDMHIAYYLLPYYPLQNVRRGTYPLMMTRMMMFGVSCVMVMRMSWWWWPRWWCLGWAAWIMYGGRWRRVLLGTLMNDSPRYKLSHTSRIQTLFHRQTSYFRIFKVHLFFVSNAHHRLDGQVDNPMWQRGQTPLQVKTCSTVQLNNYKVHTGQMHHQHEF